MLTQSELKSQLNYNHDTGVFTRKASIFKTRIGEVAGTIGVQGYSKISVFNKIYLAHRLAWLYVYGVLPHKIDHINHIRDDNRLTNLRAVSDTDNSRNCSLTKDSDCIGIWQRKENGTWRASIGHNGKNINLGTFKTKEKALMRRREAEVEYGYHPNHGL